MPRGLAHRFQIILEVLDGVGTGDVRRDHVHVVHVGHQLHRRPAAHSAAPGEQQRAAGKGEHSVNPGHVLHYLTEDEDVQVVVLATWKKEEIKESMKKQQQ